MTMANTTERKTASEVEEFGNLEQDSGEIQPELLAKIEKLNRLVDQEVDRALASVVVPDVVELI